MRPGFAAAYAGNQVKIVDKSIERCKNFSEALPKAMVICGDGAHQEILLEEGLKDLDAFVSLTGMDEENILVSIFASISACKRLQCLI